MPIKVSLHKLRNANQKQEDIMFRASVALQAAVNHRDFKSKILKTQFPESRFRDQNGRETSKSSSAVAKIIVEGLERGTSKDDEIDLEINLDNISYPTVGSTVPGRLPFRTAYWFVDLAARKKDTISPARHMIHEWLHVAGFVHVRNNGPRRDVPYMVGDIVRRILKEPGFFADASEDEEVVRELEAANEELLIPYSEL